MHLGVVTIGQAPRPDLLPAAILLARDVLARTVALLAGAG
jgi:hypothetical protein